MICKNCNIMIEDEGNYCPMCGAKIIEDRTLLKVAMYSIFVWLIFDFIFFAIRLHAMLH